MGRSQLFAIGFGALTLASSLVSQGPLYRERWADLHLELLRERVVRECAGREQPAALRASELLISTDDAIPFRPACEALASLRGVKCDDASLLRGTMGAYVLPEVVDPTAAKEDCRQLHVTALLPYALPIPSEIRFVVEVFDKAGARALAVEFGQGAQLEDLRMGYSHVEVPASDLADGAWRVRLSTWIDGKGPRDTDPVVEHTFHVLRGYQQRVEAAQQKILAAENGLPPVERALLRGMLLEINRAYSGEAFDGDSDAVTDLERAERALANLAAGKPMLDGLRTILPAALPSGGGEPVSTVLRWPTQTEGSQKRPLVCVLPGAPALDPRGRRPSAPEARTARWAFRRIGDLGLGDEWPMLWMQSQGAGHYHAKSLPMSLEAAHSLMPTDGTTIFVTELESSVAFCFSEPLLRSARALVLCGAGALARPQLESHAKLPILGIPLTGHPSSASLRFTADVADRIRADGGSCAFRLAADRPRPWVGGLAAAKAEAAAFVRESATAK